MTYQLSLFLSEFLHERSERLCNLDEIVILINQKSEIKSSQKMRRFTFVIY